MGHDRSDWVRGTLSRRQALQACEPAGDHCEPRINTVGSGAINVGRTHGQNQ